MGIDFEVQLDLGQFQVKFVGKRLLGIPVIQPLSYKVDLQRHNRPEELVHHLLFCDILMILEEELNISSHYLGAVKFEIKFPMHIILFSELFSFLQLNMIIYKFKLPFWQVYDLQKLNKYKIRTTHRVKS